MKRSLFIFTFFAVAFLLAGWPGFSQSYNLKEMPPVDPKVRSGVLDNGMHYYIRVNKLPEKRAEFYIAHNVGAIQEDDNQNGLAHFTEHMAFNGTANFPHKTMLDYLATIGVKFGTNVNAATGLEQTVYNLSNVPLIRDGVTDTALLILHDWSNYISFDPGEIEAERGVIMEEWRMYGSAEERMDNELAPVLYKGSKYAKRNVIGDTSVIRHFTRDTILDFYKKWYRPDLQAIVIVGDFDEAMMEAKVKKLFNSIPAVQNPVPKVIYPIPGNTDPLIGTATDKEATSSTVNVIFKHDPVSDKDKNLGFMRLQLIRNLINNMFGQRMNELSRKDNPPFITAYSSYGSYTHAEDAFRGSAQAADNKVLTALTALLTEMERMKEFGFTTSEFERAKADLVRNYESRYLDRNKRRNRELVYPIVSNFLVNNPNPGIEFEYSFAKAEIPGITVEEVNRMARGYVTDNNEIITVTGPDKEGITLPTNEEITRVLGKCRNLKLIPYVDLLSGKKLIEKEPVPGTLEKTEMNREMGTVEWTLSNGIKVVFKPTDFKEDELLIRGYSQGGWSQLKNDEVHTATMCGDAVSQMGVGSFTRTDLNKMMAGKKVNVSVTISEDQDAITARTSPLDVETALQLIWLYFTNPRWSDTDYKTWMDKNKAYYVNAASEPRKAFTDSVTVMLANHNPRITPMTYEGLPEITLEKLKSVYKDRFSDPGNFTFQFVGKINPEQVKPIVEKYLASLPKASRTDVFNDNGVRPPKGTVVNDFRHESTTPRTSVFISYTGSCGFSAEDKLYGAFIRHILELRYINYIREEEGGAYNIRVTYNDNKNPVPGFIMNVIFETDPAKADKLISIVKREVDRLVQNGPSEADIQKAREYFLKQRQEDLKENNWWNNTLTDYYFYNLDTVSGYDDRIKELSAGSVQDYARNLFSQGNNLEVIMRP
jgi:zinc protease